MKSVFNMKDFTLYPEALELKQLGFNEPCLGYYGTSDEDSEIVLELRQTSQEGDLAKRICSAPTYSQAFRWFREKFNMPSKIEATFEHETPNQYHYFYQVVTDNFIGGDGVMLKWTYEEAELACLKQLIEIVKENDK